jgi:hypothetical protein
VGKFNALFADDVGSAHWVILAVLRQKQPHYRSNGGASDIKEKSNYAFTVS